MDMRGALMAVGTQMAELELTELRERADEVASLMKILSSSSRQQW